MIKLIHPKSAIVEAVQFPNATLWQTSKPLSIFWFIYSCWNIHIFRFTNIWVYPFFPLLPGYIEGLLLLFPIIIPVAIFAKKCCVGFERVALAIRMRTFF